MRYKVTFAAGLAVGFVLGTRAGRERYEQLSKAAQSVMSSPPMRRLTDTAQQQAASAGASAKHAMAERATVISRRVSARVSDRLGVHHPDGTYPTVDAAN